MNFLNTIPLTFWLLTLIPLAIFLLNRRQKQIVKFSSVKFLLNLKTNEINRIKLINIILLILRTLIILLILIIIMRPYLKDILLPENFSDKKIHNYILVDDTFYNKYGYYKNELRKSYINQIISKINNQFSENTKLTIFSIKKGLIYDGFNKSEVIYTDLDKQIYNYNKNINSLNLNMKNVNNLHLISNSNKNYVNFIKDSIMSNYENFYNIYFYNLPHVDKNLFISNVRLLDKRENLYKYHYQIGNVGIEDEEFNLSIYKNEYEYDTSLKISQKIPIFTKKISVQKNKIITDTLDLKLSREHLSEIFFNLENTNQSDIADNFKEDNYFSFINNKLQNLNISVIYSNEDEKKYIKTILNSFKVLTNDIDANFFSINYVNEYQLNQYSEKILNSDIYIYLGYQPYLDNFSKIRNFSKDKKIHTLIFPSIDDKIQDSFNIPLTDSYAVNLNRIIYDDINYDTIYYNNQKYAYLESFNINKMKLNHYFDYDYDEFSNFGTTVNNSIWSTFLFENSKIDLFGFMPDKGNNFFNYESLIAAPLMYDIILDDKFDLNKNNLTINDQIKISDNVNKYRLVDALNDSIIFVSKYTPLVEKTNTRLLFENDSLIDLYSFNAPTEDIYNFYDQNFIRQNITTKIIEFSDFSNYNTNWLFSLSIDEITKYFIYLLLIIMILEMIISNVKTNIKNNRY